MPCLSCSVLCLDDWSALTEPGNVEGSVEGPIVARSIRKNHILSSPRQEHAGLHYGMKRSSPAATFVSWTCPSLDASTVLEDIIWPYLNIFDFSDFSLSFQHAIVFHYISRSLDGHWCSWSRCESGSHLRSVRSVRNNQSLMATDGHHHAAEGFHDIPWISMAFHGITEAQAGLINQIRIVHFCQASRFVDGLGLIDSSGARRPETLLLFDVSRQTYYVMYIQVR